MARTTEELIELNEKLKVRAVTVLKVYIVTYLIQVLTSIHAVRNALQISNLVGEIISGICIVIFVGAIMFSIYWQYIVNKIKKAAKADRDV